MPSVVQHISGPKITRGNGGYRADDVYKAEGYASVSAALDAVEALAPATVTDGTRLLYLSQRQCSPDSEADDVFVARLTYVEENRSQSQEPPDTGDQEVSIEIGTTSGRVTASLKTTSYDGNGSPGERDFQGAINVDMNGNPQGVDILVPNVSFVEDHWLVAGTVNATWAKTMSGIVGRTNDASFRGFSAGEVLLLGISARRRGLQDWRVNYTFAVGKNETGLSFPRTGTAIIENVAKKAHEYLWAYYKPDPSNSQKKKLQLDSIYVEQVYDEADYSQLGIGT